MPSKAMTGGARALSRADVERLMVACLESLRLARECGCVDLAELREAQLNRLLERWRS